VVAATQGRHGTLEWLAIDRAFDPQLASRTENAVYIKRHHDVSAATVSFLDFGLEPLRQ
jgi:hypothetical protein